MKTRMFVPKSELRPSKNLARLIHRKKAFVIFERSERPALHPKPFPLKETPHVQGRFFATLQNDGYLSARG